MASRRAPRIGTVGRVITLLLVVGVVGAYFWPIALTLAAAYLSYRLVLHALTDSDGWHAAKHRLPNG